MSPLDTGELRGFSLWHHRRMRHTVMHHRRRTLGVCAIAVVLAVVASACGGAGADVVRVDETVAGIDDSDEADEADERADPESMAAALLAAFSNLGEARAYRVYTSSATVNRVPSLGVDATTQIDPTRPMVVLEVAPNGDSHTVLDLGPMLAAPVADPALARELDAVGAELWLTGTRLIIDATGYQPVADLNPTYDLGPFRPGVGEVDLTRAEAVGGDELVAALVGGAPVNPIRLAATLPASLEDVVQDPDDPSVFTARSTHTTVLEAFGGDPEANAVAMAAGLAPALSVPAPELADFYVSVFARADADLELRISTSGVLETVSIVTDLSSIYSEMFSEESGLFEMTSAEREEARSYFADAVLVVESLTSFELDDSIVIDPPPGEFEDRTQDAIDYLAVALG